MSADDTSDRSAQLPPPSRSDEDAPPKSTEAAARAAAQRSDGEPDEDAPPKSTEAAARAAAQRSDDEPNGRSRSTTSSAKRHYRRMEPPSELDDGDEAPGVAKRKRQHALVYVQRLTKLYPIRRGWFGSPELVYALNGVSFYIRRRETFGLVGESGSGKTTLGRCLVRLIEPTVGRVVFDGKEVTALAPAELRLMRRRMQIVFQDPFSSLNPNMTVDEIVREGIEVFGLAGTQDEARDIAGSLLKRVGIEPSMASRYPHEFSGGQRQRIAIARALAVQPDFIVLDEPLSALDLSVQAQIMNLLDDLQQELGLTLLFISHDLRAVRYMSHRIGVLYHGRLVEVGPAEAVAQRRCHPYTRTLFGAMSGAPQEESEPTSERHRPRVLEAETPSALERTRGCPYFGRCPEAEADLCDVDTPGLEEVVKRSHHRVACWHPHTDDV